MAAFQMVHIMEGVVERGTAVVLRDLNRPLFGKTGTTSGPTNVWFVGGTPDIVAGVYVGFDRPRSLGGYAQGGRIAAPIFKQWAIASLQDHPKVPFVAPPGIRWVRIDRVTGKRVFGTFPVKEDPKSSVIWEAFQPQTEPRRSYRGTTGDPYGEQPQQQQQRPQQPQVERRDAAPPQQAVRPPAQPSTVQRPAPVQAPPPASPQGNGLQTQNRVH
jgi:penicillin-binding protein 1A